VSLGALKNKCPQTHAGKLKKYLPDGDFLPNKSCFSGIFNQIERIPLNNISIIVGLNWRGLFTCVSLGASKNQSREY
jgi:hypothetical protein